MYLLSVYNVKNKWKYYLFDSRDELLHWYKIYQKREGILVRAYKLLEGEIC